MKEMANPKETFEAVRAAIQFAIKRENDYRRENGWPLEGLEKVIFVLQRLRPQELKKRLNWYSSYEYGRSLSYDVFPKFENPESFHSTPYEIDLSDNPIQVLGWKDLDNLISKGEKIGLTKGFIQMGFDEECENRGIDLEWHFFEVPQNHQTGGLAGTSLEL